MSDARRTTTQRPARVVRAAARKEPEVDYQVIDEDPRFATDFVRLTHDGADPELVAMVAPLLRGEDDGGSLRAIQAAERFLAQQSLHGPVRDRAAMAQARSDAVDLVHQFGQRVDRGLVQRYAPDAAQINRAWDERFPARGGEAIVLPDKPESPAVEPLPERDRPTYSDFGPRPFWEFD